MTFKELKQGSSVYVLDKEKIELKKGLVTSVSLPHMSTDPSKQLSTAIDITVSVDNKAQKYEVRDSGEAAYAGNILISTTLERALEDVKMSQQQAQEVIDNLEKSKETVKKCKSLLEEFDPVYRSNAETDSRLTKIESSITTLAATVNKLVESLK